MMQLGWDMHLDTDNVPPAAPDTEPSLPPVSDSEPELSPEPPIREVVATNPTQAFVERKRIVIEYLTWYWATHGKSPRLREIGARLGFTRSVDQQARTVLVRMKLEGLIDYGGATEEVKSYRVVGAQHIEHIAPAPAAAPAKPKESAPPPPPAVVVAPVEQPKPPKLPPPPPLPVVVKVQAPPPPPLPVPAKVATPPVAPVPATVAESLCAVRALVPAAKQEPSVPIFVWKLADTHFSDIANRAWGCAEPHQPGASAELRKALNGKLAAIERGANPDSLVSVCLDLLIAIRVCRGETGNMTREEFDRDVHKVLAEIRARGPIEQPPARFIRVSLLDRARIQVGEAFFRMQRGAWERAELDAIEGLLLLRYMGARK